MSARGLNVFVNIGGKLLPSLNSAATGVERRFKTMSRRLRLSMAEVKAETKALTNSMKPLAAMAAAGGLSFGVKRVIGDGASFMHEVAALRLAGRSAGEVALAMKQAHKTMNEVPTSTLVDNLKVLRETTGAYGDVKHAMENLSFNQRLGYMMTNVMGMDREESMHKLVAGIQALEIRGSAMDHDRYQREMNSLFQASAFFAGKEGAFTPESLRNFAKTGNIPLKLMSERFMTKILPAMITEVGSGDIVGTQASAFNNWLNGNTGTGNKAKTKFAQKIGLVTSTDQSQLTKTGWKPGAVLGSSLAKEDTFKWVETILLPKLAKAGFNVNDTKSLEVGIASLFGRETAKRYIMGMADPLQRKRLHKDEENINKAMSSEEGYKFMLANDPTAAWAKILAKLDNLATILGEKVFTDKTIGAIDKFATGIDKLGGFFDKHPTLAKGAVGGMALGALGGLASLFGAGGFIKFIGKGILKGAGALAGLAGRILLPLSRALLNGLVRFGPLIIRGLFMAFGVLANPVAWVIMGAIALALVWRFRHEIANYWNNTVVPWFKNAWQRIKATAMSINWGSVGMAIADALTFGLASKFKAGLEKLKPSAAALAGNVGMNSKAGGLAGMRANGGPVLGGRLYMVGERGPELFAPGASGRIVPNHHVRSMARRQNAGNAFGRPVHVGEIHVHGVNDPVAVAREVKRQLNGLGNGQAALLSD